MIPGPALAVAFCLCGVESRGVAQDRELGVSLGPFMGMLYVCGGVWNHAHMLVGVFGGWYPVQW